MIAGLTVVGLILWAAAAVIWWDLHRPIGHDRADSPAADMRELAAGITLMPGGITKGGLCTSCLTRPSELPHPDHEHDPEDRGHVCSVCWLALTIHHPGDAS